MNRRLVATATPRETKRYSRMAAAAPTGKSRAVANGPSLSATAGSTAKQTKYDSVEAAITPKVIQRHWTVVTNQGRPANDGRTRIACSFCPVVAIRSARDAIVGAS